MPENIPPILYVEDNLGDVRLVKRCLEKTGVDNELVCASDGQEGLDVVNGQHPEITINAPFFILTDINMPRITGLEMVEQIKKQKEFENVPVIIFTTSPQTSDQMKALELGAVQYVNKENMEKELPQLLKMLNKLHS